MVWGALAIMPFTIFSGFFVHMNDAPTYFQWLFHISYLKYGLDGVLISIYSFERERLQCSIDYCHFTSPKKFLEALDMGNGSYWINVLILVIMFFSLRLISYLILLYRLTNRRWHTTVCSLLLSCYILTKFVTLGANCFKHPWPSFSNTRVASKCKLLFFFFSRNISVSGIAWLPGVRTVMRHITTFRSMTDRIYDGGLIRL